MASTAPPAPTPTDSQQRTRSIALPGILLGVGLGGFVDGIRPVDLTADPRSP